MAHPKSRTGYSVVHGHFYQPPRENPWIEAIETEESAHPFHDWNERITLECYRPNAYARIQDGRGRILQIANNYSFISFNFGPTLFSWLEKRFPPVYQKIIEADRESLRRWGHGNAIAQTYHHVIMPLADERDKETEVLWGIADFEKRFQRKPEAMWLPETAVDQETLRVLIRNGMRYLILSPFQALRTRPFEGKRWTDVSQGRIDTTRPYRCFIRDKSGRKHSDQFIDIFFYYGIISKETAFGDLLRDGEAFSDRFVQFSQESKGRPTLVHIATDGETYGHHKKFGEMALAYALNTGLPSRGFEITNYGSFLKQFPPVYEVEIDEGPKGEGTAWSCAHGVGRWKEDCGCSTGGGEGWNQKWRGPLREALHFLKGRLHSLFEEEGKGIFEDVWKARNGYIEIILDRSAEKVKAFFEQYGSGGLDERRRIKGLKLLEMERHGLQMFTSCGWFFSDLAGLETVQVLTYAARAIELAEDLSGQELEKEFLEYLARGRSNLPEAGDGRQVFERLVKPKRVTPEKVVNHFAITSFFVGEEMETNLYSFHLEALNLERVKGEKRAALLGRVRVTSGIIPEPKEFLFVLIPSIKEVCRTFVSEFKGDFDFSALKEAFFKHLEATETELDRVLRSILGDRHYSMKDAFQEGRHAIIEKLFEEERTKYRRICAELFDQTREIAEALSREGLEVPGDIRIAAEMALSDRLLQEVQALREDFDEVLRRGEIDRIVEASKVRGYRLKTEEVLPILSGMLYDRMRLLWQEKGADPSLQSSRVEEVLTFLNVVKEWGSEPSKEEAQNLMFEILDAFQENLEKGWRGEGRPKPFSPRLLLLAERLGFSVDRFPK